jgi:predicted Zn-dependent peptidase
MKTKARILLSAFLMVLTTVCGQIIFAQKVYKYDTVPGDPIKVRIYTLDNGLKIFTTVYKDAPRVQTAIAVKTGSKNDPADNTGLSHYLEHMMFKGTLEFGTKDFAKEKPLLDQIENEFEIYRKTTDTLQRKAIYHVIDSLSGVASTYAIANEYDKLLSVIGAKGTNAFTSHEETVYVNDVPSNKMNPWLEIEYERFREPVFRLFHTELETVYEEKNMSLDRDNDKVFDALFSGLFQKNTYGTQTTIGTVEHLKNPSLTSLKAYYNSRYVPNNMAIILCGDFDPNQVVPEIDKTFGTLPSRPVPPYIPAKEDPIMKPIVKDVVGPDAESVTIGYRLGGAGTRDADLLQLFSMILTNNTAGLIDLNLVQAQKVLEADCFPYILKDYSASIFSGKPKEGQTLEQVKDLIMGQIELVKKGDFPDWLLPAIINDLKLERIKSSESNRGRMYGLMNDFVQDIPRTQTVGEIDRLSKITKKEIVEFAKKNYTDDYVVVYKRTGVDKNVNKVIKPQITAVTMNRDDESEFLKKIMAEPTPDIKPVFLDYDKDVKKYPIKNNIQLLYTKNTETPTFSLYYYFRMGTNNQKAIGTALDYLNYLGTSKYSPKEVQEEFYKIGCSLSVNSSENEVWVMLTGLSENMDKGLHLFEHLLSDAKPNPPALDNLVQDIGKRRADAKLNKNAILMSAMNNYAQYGKTSPYTNILSEKELGSLKPEDLIKLIKDLNTYNHKVLYYGPMEPAAMVSSLNKEHKTPAKLSDYPVPVKFEQLPTTDTKVYTVGYDMKQVEILMLSRSDLYNKDLVPVTRLFNEYFGGSMNSIVFQEIRESKGLAYSAYAGYRMPANPDLHAYVFSYIGTQVDKLPEAMKAMMGIFNNMPESDKALAASKEAILNKIRTERITKAQILFNYLNAEKFGLTYDIRKDVFSKVPSMTFADMKSFQEKYIKGKSYSIMVLGKKSALDQNTLKTYGPVNELSLEDVFGY